MPDHLDRFLDELDLEADIEDINLDREQLHQLALMRRAIRREGDRIMADLTNLSTALDSLGADTAAAAADVSAKLDALLADIAALSAGTITQDQIDSLTTKAQAADAAVQAIDAAAQAANPPA